MLHEKVVEQRVCPNVRLKRAGNIKSKRLILGVGEKKFGMGGKGKQRRQRTGDNGEFGMHERAPCPWVRSFQEVCTYESSCMPSNRESLGGPPYIHNGPTCAAPFNSEKFSNIVQLW